MAGQPLDVPRPTSVLDRMDFLAGEEYDLQPLPGGLTNRNFRVTTSTGRRYVARFSGDNSELLWIDRDAEAHDSAVAAGLGVAPRVVAYSSAPHVLVVDWIEARTLAGADLDDPDMLTRLAQVCRRLHSGPRFVRDFDMFAVQRGYLDTVRQIGARLPADYLDFEPLVRELDQILHASRPGTVACHNDLLAANILDDGRRIWLVDFEYAGNNDPCFELGNIWSEADLPADRLDHLVAAYYGRSAPVETARARLFGGLAKYGWTLWACIQDAVSAVDFDFWDWGMAKYVRAVSEFRSPSWQRLIDTVREATTHEGAQPWPTPSA